MRSTLFALLFAGVVWAQPQPLQPRVVQSLLGLPEPLEVSSPLELPREIRDKVVWEQTLRPSTEGGLDSVTLMLLKGPALLSTLKLDLMEVDLRRLVDRIPTRLRREEREQIEKYIEDRSPFVRLAGGRRGLIAASQATAKDGGGASLVLPTPDGQYELALYVFAADAEALREAPDRAFWERYDWLSELKRAAPKLDAMLVTAKF